MTRSYLSFNLAMREVWCFLLLLNLALTIREVRPDGIWTRRYRNITDEEALEKAREIMSNYPLVDGHNDLANRYRSRVENSIYSINLEEDVSEQWGYSHTDIPRLREGQVGAQFWAIYQNCAKYEKDAVRAYLDQIDTMIRVIEKYPDHFELVTTADGIEAAFERGLVGSLLGIEGGHAFDSSLAALRMFYELGARYLGLTHSCTLPWVDASPEEDNEEPTHGGLTDFGRLMIQECNRLGMIVDLAHVSRDVMSDVLDVSVAPIIFSHSDVRALCDHNRNVPDDIMERLPENGGVMMICFYPGHLGCYPSNETEVNIALVADHIEYVRDLIGVEYVGIGSDYDGFTTAPVGLEDVSTFPYLIAELVKRGWEDNHLEMLIGRNLVNAFRQVEQVRDNLAIEGMLPLEDWIPTEDIPDTDECRTTG